MTFPTGIDPTTGRLEEEELQEVQVEEQEEEEARKENDPGQLTTKLPGLCSIFSRRSS